MEHGQKTGFVVQVLHISVRLRDSGSAAKAANSFRRIARERAYNGLCNLVLRKDFPRFNFA